MTHRIGIVGAGAIAREHLQAFEAIPNVEVAFVLDRHSERAQRLAQMAGAARWGSDFDELLNDSSIEAIDICTSPDSHADYTIAAAEAGKAIHLEKPVALSLTEVDRMLDAVETAGVPFMVGQTTRFQPVHLEMAAAIEAGAIGQPRAVHASFYVGHLWPGGWRAWQMNIERCGGHLVHNGIHVIDLATWLLGALPTRVFARGLTSFSPGMPTPDTFHVVLRYNNGAMAVLEWSYALHKRGDVMKRLSVIGEEGTLMHSTEGEIDVHSDAIAPPAIGTLGSFENQLRHFADVLDGKTEPITTPGQIRGAFAAALAAQESYATGNAVELTREEVSR